MDLFKFSKRVIFVFIALCVMFTLCSDAKAAGRIGIYDVSVIEGDITDTAPKTYSMADWKRMEQLKQKYTEVVMGIFSERTETVKLTTEYDKTMQQVQEAQKKSSPFGFGNLFGGNRQKQEDYKPYVNRTMTSDANSSMETYIKYHTDAGAKEKCDHVVDCVINIDDKFVTVNMNLYDVRKRTVNFKYVASSAISSSSSLRQSSSKSSSTKAKTKTKSSSSKTKKSKNKPDQTQDTAQEQAVITALNKLAVYMLDDISGNTAKIINVAYDNVTINKGTSSKVAVGDMFSVQAKISDGMDEIFGAEKETLPEKTVALIKITDAQENSSTAEIINGAGNISLIRPEDTIKILTHKELEYFNDGKYKFPDKRVDVKKAEVKAAETKTKPQANKTVAKAEPLPALPPGTVRIGIMRFNSDAYEVTDEEALSLTDLLSRMLSNSDKIVVLERDRLEAIAGEQKLNLSGIIDPATAAQIGKLASCQYVLMGSVTGLQESDTVSGQYIRPTNKSTYVPNVPAGYQLSTAGKVLVGIQLLGMVLDAAEGPKDNVVTETHETITAVDARLVDVQTSQIIAAFSEQGSAAQSDIITQDKDGHVKSVEANHGSLQNRSIASAAANLGYKIREKLAGEQVQISAVNDSEIIINRGDSSGVQVGDLFCVYSDGKTGGDTDAIISVTEVQEAFSTAEIAASVADSYSPVPGNRLEPVLNSDYQKGIWHIKNTRRQQASETAKDNLSLEELANSSGRKKRFETSATDAKKVIKSYGLSSSQEKALINAHSKASKASSTKKKYEAYKQISNANSEDFLAAYNTGKYALEQSMYIEAREWASKALFINPNYKPAQALIEKIDKGE